MRNEVFQERASNARFALCPTSIVGGDVVLLGSLPAVALESYNAALGGTTFRFSGTYELTVIAATAVSPVTGSEVEQGDTIYATGTYDAATNITHSLTLSKATGGTKVGTYDSTTPIASGLTDTAARVRLREVGA